MKIKLFEKTEPFKSEIFNGLVHHEKYIVGNYVIDERIIEHAHGSNSIDYTVSNAVTALKYQPQIYIGYPIFGDMDKIEISIQTTSYGSLTADNLKLYIEAYNHALEVAKTIEASDILK